MAQTEYAHNDHLRELHSSEFEMVSGEPDIRNWKVIGLQNQELGKVDELLFNDLSHRVRYLVVNIDGKPINLLSRTVLIPVALADLLTQEKVVLLRGITIGHLASLPTYEKGKISRETELAIRDIFSPGSAAPYADRELVDDGEFYEQEHFRNESTPRRGMEVAEKKSVKEEMKENLERVKETVRKMEGNVDKMG